MQQPLGEFGIADAALNLHPARHSQKWSGNSAVDSRAVSKAACQSPPRATGHSASRQSTGGYRGVFSASSNSG